MNRFVGLIAGLCCVLLAPGAAAAQTAAPVPELTAAGAVVWDPADGKVLFGKAERVPRAMASTTKIMTALLVLESGAADEILTVSARAASFGEATLGLRAGQRIAVSAVVAGLLIRSGNDAAVALAEHVAGSEAAFVEKMNARAAELGLTDTRFVNASGLTDDPGHRSSPLDLARLAQVAMADPRFADWAGSASLVVPPFGRLENRNRLLGTYPGASGVKTGNTALAGWCLVASATRSGRTLYAVVLDSLSADTYFGEAAALLEHGFTAYRRPQPVTAGVPVTPYRWADASVPLISHEALARTVGVGASATWRTVLHPALERPLRAGAPAGVAELLVDGEVIASSPLLTAAAVPAPHAPQDARDVGAAVQDALRALARLSPAQRAA